SELDEQARRITRYLLFADEVPLPAGGLEPDPAYRADFLSNRRATPEGGALKDLDLKTRLVKYRCSYMIYSPVCEGLPATLKEGVYEQLRKALRDANPDPDFGYLPAAERKSIRLILKATVKDLLW